MGGKPLNHRQQKFVEHYLACGVAGKAMVLAGYAAKSADQEGSKLLKNPKIREAVMRGREKAQDITGIDPQWVLRRTAMLAEFNINKFVRVQADGSPVYDFTNATDDDWYCISELTVDRIMKGQGEGVYEIERVKVKAHDKLKAIELVGRNVLVQAFKDNVKVEVDDLATLLGKRRAAALQS
jgi:phage terminase small subunit